MQVLMRHSQDVDARHSEFVLLCVLWTLMLPSKLHFLFDVVVGEVRRVPFAGILHMQLHSLHRFRFLLFFFSALK